ncbi:MULTISPECIES: nuclear transport factor 2 family protein [Halomonas]|uniref:SnoaL-like protein n=1 Tax=Halomonas ventosae TaxID=229007 RepID=A0A4R6HQ67_9GAMM|nr:nuclear transport factor 2 family protein [Halomonas ventosae]TDO10491.1 SnoaL-like protein [Halomonas ventosae]
MQPPADLEAFCAFFNKLDKNCTVKLYDVYTEDVEFIDPLHHIRGREALKAYFATLYDNVTSCRFTFHETLRQHDTAFVTWTMHLVHPRLNGARQVDVEGCSHLCIAQDGRVARHRDYFDVGALLYERLPLLGSAIRLVKRQLGR